VFWLRGGPVRNAVLFLVAAGGYLSVLRVLGVISARDLRAVYRALGVARAASPQAGEVAP
jgi:hypothetical protein